MPKNKYECSNCGKELWKWPSRVKRNKNVFCSYSCSSYWNLVNGIKPAFTQDASFNPNYKDGVIGNRRRVKKAAKERDQWTCKMCGRSRLKGKEAHAHHVIPLCVGGEDQIDNLVTLCNNCHMTAENQMLQAVWQLAVDSGISLVKLKAVCVDSINV